MNKKTASIIIVLVIINIICIREIIKYEPNVYKYRVYNNLKQAGWFDSGTKVETLKSDNIAYMLTLGQSNAGNSSNSLDTAGSDAFSYYRGKLYRAADPMIGCSGAGGSVWPLLADKLLQNKLYKKVVIIPIAVGSTDIENWAHGKCSIILKNTLDDLNAHHIKLTHILWNQGENNNGTPKADYKRNLAVILNTIRQNGQHAPFYCSIDSYAPSPLSKTKGIDVNIEQAQIEFINENKGVLAGPNTDTILDAIDRHDSQHFSKIGKEKYAKLWLASLINNAENQQ